ncbi:MAG: serine hydrolase domain-containing protein [Acidimicrobiales bacterium]
MSALALIDAWPVASPAVAVLVDGEIVDDRGPTSLPLPWASVTKLVTSLAAFLAIAEGHLELATPAGPPGSTVAHLLAHASGLDAQHDRVRVAPGVRRIYSNAGYEVLARVVAASVGLRFDHWVCERILEPLGLTDTVVSGSAASGIRGPLGDLVGLVEELQRPSLLPPGLAAAQRSIAFAGLGGVLPGFGEQPTNDWGLGPEIRAHKSPHWTGTTNSPATFGHFGAAGGFVWIDPINRVACACLTGTPFGPWAASAWPALSDAIVVEHGRAVPGPVTDPS